jgi:hypothetical protein
MEREEPSDWTCGCAETRAMPRFLKYGRTLDVHIHLCGLTSHVSRGLFRARVIPSFCLSKGGCRVMLPARVIALINALVPANPCFVCQLGHAKWLEMEHSKVPKQRSVIVPCAWVSLGHKRLAFFQGQTTLGSIDNSMRLRTAFFSAGSVSAECNICATPGIRHSSPTAVSHHGTAMLVASGVPVC